MRPERPELGEKPWVREGEGEYRLFRFIQPANEEEILELAEQILRSRIREKRPLSAPAQAVDYLRLCLRRQDRELFHVLFLDTRHHVVADETLFFGTLNGATVHPRDVVKAALSHNASAVILAHNHPSGNAEPSQSDATLTRRLRDALDLVDIRVLDHLVIGDDDYVSLSDRGLF